MKSTFLEGLNIAALTALVVAAYAALANHCISTAQSFVVERLLGALGR